LRYTSVIRLAPHEAISLYFNVHVLGQRIDDRDTDTVEPTRDRVALAAEFSTRMKNRHNNFDCRLLLYRMLVNGDTAAIVIHTNGAISEKRDFNVVAMASERLVNGVVHHLVDQVMETSLACGPDIHTGSFTNGVEALENCNCTSVV
jgi:hypothetical protein